MGELAGRRLRRASRRPTRRSPTTQVLRRALQYAATFGYIGLAASAGLASAPRRRRARRRGRDAPRPDSAIPVGRQESSRLARSRAGAKKPARVCTSRRLSAREGVATVARQRRRCSTLTCDVAVPPRPSVRRRHRLVRCAMPHLVRHCGVRAIATPLRAGLADGTIDAISARPCAGRRRQQSSLPFAEAEPGAIGRELLPPPRRSALQMREAKIPAGRGACPHYSRADRPGYSASSARPSATPGAAADVCIVAIDETPRTVTRDALQGARAEEHADSGPRARRAGSRHTAGRRADRLSIRMPAAG